MNEAKSEFAWFRRFGKASRPSSLDRSVTVGSSSVVRVILDAELTMKPHIARLTSSCFYQLRRLKHVHSVGQELTAQLVHVFVLSRLDYGNSVLQYKQVSKGDKDLNLSKCGFGGN